MCSGLKSSTKIHQQIMQKVIIYSDVVVIERVD